MEPISMIDVFLVIAATMAAIALIGGPLAVANAVNVNKAKHHETGAAPQPERVHA
jgi:hypothetical protein